MRRDREGDQFPWAPQPVELEATGDDGALHVMKVDPEFARDNSSSNLTAGAAPHAQAFSRKRQYVPVLLVVAALCFALFGCWPLGIVAAAFGKGECRVHMKNYQGEDTEECALADAAGGATCNVALLQPWFLVTGIGSVLLLLVVGRLVVAVWRRGLGQWDATLTNHWVSGCFGIVLFLFLAVWYIVGNVLIWSARDEVCGALSTHGKIYFYATYIANGCTLLAVCVRFARESRVRPVRSMEQELQSVAVVPRAAAPATAAAAPAAHSRKKAKRAPKHAVPLQPVRLQRPPKQHRV
ncbi:hypothetical protein DIPPA_31058 [Diplonema papillatum]|nr:hypothetical protein DIPPA_31058 [Diplonema papillatum]